MTHDHENAEPHMHKDFDYLREVFTYHPPRVGQVEKYQTIRDAGFELSNLIRDLVPNSREMEHAIDHVRNAIMWANAGLAIHDPTPEDVKPEVLHFFGGDMTEDEARTLKAAWQDGYYPGGESDPQRTFGPQTPEETPSTTLSEPADLDWKMTDGEKPVAQETYLTDDERIGALQIGDDGLCAFDGAQVSPTGNVFDNGNDLVCLNCGRTGPYSLVEEEQTDEAPKKGCPECGMNEPHVHIDDKTFLGDENGPEIRVLTGMTALLGHHGIEGVPYVVLDNSDTDKDETTVSINVPEGTDANGVSDLVQSFLDRNPNALVEPINSQVVTWINRGCDLVSEPKHSGAPDHDHSTTEDCSMSCPNMQWWRNR